MEGEKVIFVTGGTGNQGGAIAKSLNQSDHWAVVVLSRDSESKASKNLKDLGIEVLKGDLDDPSSYSNYLTDVDGIFSVQNFIYGIDKEIKYGKQLADLAKQKKINHFLYSSVSGADLGSGIPHFESKHAIENHIKQIGIPYTIIRPTSFYETLLIPDVMKRVWKGKLVMPLKKDLYQEYISMPDIGIIGKQIFENPEKYLGKTITIASDKMKVEELAILISETLNKKITYQKLPRLITRLVMGSNLYKMFDWINKNEPELVVDIDSLKKEFPGLTNMKSWLKKEFIQIALKNN